MRPWADRTKEEAYLLNPAFCCVVLTAAISGFVSVRQEDGVPFPFAFMFLPIALHKPTRDSLPATTRTSMAAWLQEHSDARVLFYERLVSLKPHTREAIQFGMQADWIGLDEGGFLGTSLTERDVERNVQAFDSDSRNCVMRARFLGRWFAAGGPTHTVMAFWGIRP